MYIWTPGRHYDTSTNARYPYYIDVPHWTGLRVLGVKIAKSVGWLTRRIWWHRRWQNVEIAPPPAQRAPERVLPLPIVAATITRMVFGPSERERRQMKRRAFVHSLAT